MKNDKLKTIKKVLKLAHNLQPGHIALIIVQRLINAAAPFVSIIFSSIILDQLLAHAPFEDIIKNALIMIVINCLIPLIYWGLEHIVSTKSAVLHEKIDKMICEKSFTLDFDILEKRETLDLIKKAQEGMNSHGNITDFCKNFGGIMEQIATIIYSVIILIPLFFTSPTAPQGFLPQLLNQWYCVFILIAALLLKVLLSSFLDVKTQRIQQTFFVDNVRINREYGYYFDFMFDYSLGKYTRLYKSQPMLVEKTESTLNWMEQRFKELINKLNRVQAPSFLASIVLQFISYAFVGLKAIYGFISVGNALKFGTAYLNLVESISQISYNFINLNIKSEYLSYFYDFMEIKNKRYDGTIPTEKRDDNEFEIEFRDVSFRYANTDKDVIKHLNQKIKIGTKTAVVGKNGAGKTTFIKLLTRLYEPTEGQILLNGVDIRYYDYADYSKLFSVVFQDFNLFSFTIGENVGSSANYDENKVRDCCERAGFGERLAKLEDGLKTNIYQQEDGGVEISGGEAQKLAIARALYKDAPMVILDEPTSALDPISEYEIYKHFDEMVQDKTSIYISHRMSSCRFCDNILVFDDGQIVEQGSHNQLVKNNGLYSQLWNAQAQYYEV